MPLPGRRRDMGRAATSMWDTSFWLLILGSRRLSRPLPRRQRGIQSVEILLLRTTEAVFVSVRMMGVPYWSSYSREGPEIPAAAFDLWSADYSGAQVGPTIRLILGVAASSFRWF